MELPMNVADYNQTVTSCISVTEQEHVYNTKKKKKKKHSDPKSRVKHNAHILATFGQHFLSTGVPL